MHHQSTQNPKPFQRKLKHKKERSSPENIQQNQNQSKRKQAIAVFVNHVWVLRNHPSHEIGDSHIQKHREEKGETEHGLKDAIGCRTQFILHLNIYQKYCRWFDKQI